MVDYYKELSSDYRLVRENNRSTGTRTVIDVDTEPEECAMDLPVVGTSYFNATNQGCLCHSVTKLPYGKPKIFKYVAQYSTDPLPENTEYGTRYTGAAKIESIKLASTEKGWWWKRFGETTTNQSITNQSIFRMSVHGTYSEQVIVPDQREDIWYPGLSAFDEYRAIDGTPNYGLYYSEGRLNKETYAGFKPGQLLFTTFDTKPSRDKNGVKIWIITLNFSYIKLDIGATEEGKDVPHSWQYLLNDAAKEGEDKYQAPIKVKDLTDKPFGTDDTYTYNYAIFEDSLTTTLPS